MDEIENITQKHVVNFCKSLPGNIDKIDSIIKDAKKSLNTLENFVEQNYCVNQCNINYLDNFESLQRSLSYQIQNETEEELVHLKSNIEKLNNTNHDIKNKLSILERSSQDLDWDGDSALVKGSSIQPPLSRILEDGYKLWNYFAGGIKFINDAYKLLNINNMDSVTNLKNAFEIDLNLDFITFYLALIQYVDNEQAIV